MKTFIKAKKILNVNLTLNWLSKPFLETTAGTTSLIKRTGKFVGYNSAVKIWIKLIELTTSMFTSSADTRKNQKPLFGF